MKYEFSCGEPYECEPLGQYIVRAVGVCGGRPIVKYTRIEMSDLLDRVAQGDSISEIVGDYRGRVSREAVVEAIKIGFLFLKKPSLTKDGMCQIGKLELDAYCPR